MPKDVKVKRKHIWKHEVKFRLTWAHKGMLRKLNSDGDPMKADHWRKRDFWIDWNGALCYFSTKHNKAMVLIDADNLRCASIRVVDEAKVLIDAGNLRCASIQVVDGLGVWAY